jgi:DNA-binding MurR/RpiR family transcriptional regulator
MLDRIQASLHTLSPSEQRVGDLLLQDARHFANTAVADLAAQAQVSKPTVVRFCRSLGYAGLSDFKLKLAGSLSEGVPFIHRNVNADDKAGDVLVKVVDNAAAAFLKYRNDASGAAIEKLPKPWPKPNAKTSGWNSLVWATRASWRKTRSTNFSGWAFTPAPTAMAICKS